MVTKEAMKKHFDVIRWWMSQPEDIKVWTKETTGSEWYLDSAYHMV